MIEIKGPFSSKQVERVYNDLMSTDFYDELYNAHNWTPEPYEHMAEIIEGVLQPKPQAQMLDIGCGRGYLTLALLKRGYRALGTEFSPRMFNAIPEDERNHFRLISSLDELDLTSFDAITSFEVFEHLPLAIIVNNLAVIRRGFRGDLLLTIPSSGQDRTLPGLGFNEDNERLQSMAENKVTPYLVYENEVVGGGHITLAGYRWWEDFFLTQGFARHTDLEIRLRQFLPHLISINMRWCFYVLKPLDLDALIFGRGWHRSEDDNGRVFRWNGPSAELHFITERNKFDIGLDLVLPPPNIAIDSNLRYFVQEMSIIGDYKIAGNVVASGWLDLNGDGRDRHVTIPVTGQALSVQAGENFPAEDGAIKAFRAYKLHIHTPTFIPKDYYDSLDERELGFQFMRPAISTALEG